MRSNQQTSGYALAMVLLIVGVLAVMIAASLALANINKKISSNDSLTAQSLNVAQAGSAFWKAELISLYRFMSANFHLYEDEINAMGGSIACGNYFAIGLDLTRDGDVTDSGDVPVGGKFPTRTIPVGSESGTAVVTFRINGSAIILDSKGSYKGSSGRVQEAFSINSINIWNNAVFAQSGAANATIRGRAEIRGSIHVLGENLSSTDMALDVSGSFALGNTYRDVSPSLKISQMGLTVSDPKDLCATLRVKRGYVKMGSNGSQIGFDESKYTEPVIDNMHGIYTNDGIQGGTEGSNIFSMNGKDAKYDAGNSFVFPMLNKPIEEGQTLTWAQQLERNSLILEIGSDGRPSTNDDRRFFGTALTPQIVNGQKYYLGANCFASALFGSTVGSTSSEFRLTTDNTSNFSCTKYKMLGAVPNILTDEVVTEVIFRDTASNSVATSGDTTGFSINTMYVGGTGGVVTFKGRRLALDGSGGNNIRLAYKGRGILFTEVANTASLDSNGSPINPNTLVDGSMSLEMDYLPAMNDKALRIDTTGRPRNLTINNSFPATAAVGLVARNKVITDGAQQRFTVAMYAQESIKVVQQTLVVGGAVTQEFDAGSQVPTILYTPNLSEYLPKFMPGGRGNGVALTDVSWIRR